MMSKSQHKTMKDSEYIAFVSKVDLPNVHRHYLQFLTCTYQLEDFGPPICSHVLIT